MNPRDLVQAQRVVKRHLAKRVKPRAVTPDQIQVRDSRSDWGVPIDAVVVKGLADVANSLLADLAPIMAKKRNLDLAVDFRLRPEQLFKSWLKNLLWRAKPTVRKLFKGKQRGKVQDFDVVFNEKTNAGELTREAILDLATRSI